MKKENSVRKVTRIISESEFARIEEVEDSSPDEPTTMTREELIQANQSYYRDLRALLGKRTGKQVFDNYINGVMLQQQESLRNPTEHHLVRTTLKKATTE